MSKYLKMKLATFTNSQTDYLKKGNKFDEKYSNFKFKRDISSINIYMKPTNYP
jgi:hypothetical protein